MIPPEERKDMAFQLTEKNGLSWVSSDLLEARHLFTRRLGGVGDYPYSSDPASVWWTPEVQSRVRELWTRFRDAGGFPEEGFCFTHQIHGTEIRYVTEAERLLPPLAAVPADCDGLITDRRGVPLCIFTADCVPVLLSEPERGIVCAVHSGWKGTVKDMMGSAARAICAMGGRVENIRAAIGPAASGCCYETGPEVKEAAEALLGADAEGTCPPEEGVPGKFMVDLKEINRRRLLQLGVAAERIDVSADCTMHMSDVYWSHRVSKGVRGTMASVIML